MPSCLLPVLCAAYQRQSVYQHACDQYNTDIDKCSDKCYIYTPEQGVVPLSTKDDLAYLLTTETYADQLARYIELAIAQIPATQAVIILSDFNHADCINCLAKATQTHRITALYITYPLTIQLGSDTWTWVRYNRKKRLIHPHDPDLVSRTEAIQALIRAQLYNLSKKTTLQIKWH